MLSRTSQILLSIRQSARQLSTHSHCYIWGTDAGGTLWKPKDPSETAKKRDVPVEVDSSFVSGSSIRKLVCGSTDTALLMEDGRCFVMGLNKYGQLGVGHKNPVLSPTEIMLPTEDPKTGITDVSIGISFSAFVDEVGDLYTAGFNGSTLSGGMGYLGLGDGNERLQPTLVASLIEDGCQVKQVAVGEAHMTVLTTEGEVLSCGSGSFGRLGNFDAIDQLYLEPVELLTSGVEAIAGGKSFTLALKDGIVYGWGKNGKGQLGTGLGLAVDMYAMQSVPEPIDTDELSNRKVIKIAAGHSHAAAVTESGELFKWGMSLDFEPRRVDEMVHTRVVDVFCGEDYTLALSNDGKLYSFGQGKAGTLGAGSPKYLNTATMMEFFDNREVLSASAGWKHAGCLVRDRV
jgi:alpha-tubulin suppressor-like RCC1 family protein